MVLRSNNSYNCIITRHLALKHYNITSEDRYISCIQVSRRLSNLLINISLLQRSVLVVADRDTTDTCNCTLITYTMNCFLIFT